MTTTTEAPFSANFAMFNVDGLKVQFTVRADEQPKHMALLQSQLDTLLKAGWRVTEPTGNSKPKTVHITGWVKGTAENKQKAQFEPCVHLYADYGDFKQCTVYMERLQELPLDLKLAKTWDGAAPDKASALKRGVMNHCSFDVILEPVLLPDGNPKVNDKGYTQYKFGGVKGAAPQPAPEIDMSKVGEMNPDPNADLWQPSPPRPAELKKQAAKGFTWPTDEDMLGIASGTLQMGDEVPSEAMRVVVYFNKLHHSSDGKTLSTTSANGRNGQYGFLAGMLDKKYGDGSHSMILSALCGVSITQENPPGWKVKELLDGLLAPDTYKEKLDCLDKVAAFVKQLAQDAME